MQGEKIFFQEALVHRKGNWLDMREWYTIRYYLIGELGTRL